MQPIQVCSPSPPRGVSPHGSYPFCPESYWVFAHRWYAHRPVQLAVCPPPRRPVHPTHDDTDQKRNVSEALRPILDGFRWLGLHWDEGAEVGGPYGPYYQSQKLARYQAAVRELVEKGLAYRDYTTVDELRAEQQAAD
jgi:hypothetical protein